jgi:UDP-N-acetylglucosamine--N-acetylmuramyl-(pentapeptide) pyrophosphoryl-undecaprenol N-acetylglucosamine transferase
MNRLTNEQPRILVMAGGTGGHVYPALAVARTLREAGAAVSWLGTERGLEARVVPEAGFPIDYIRITGLRGNGALGWLLAPWRILRALSQSLAVLRRRRPQAVLGMGGFASGPGGLAAWLSRRPLLIHEQNAAAGLTNRLLAPVAIRVMEAFPGTFRAGLGALLTGNPVRTEIAGVEQPGARYARRSGPLRLFVVGGSLGAAVLNSTVPAALARLAEADRPQVRHQTGPQHLEATREAYREAGVEAEVLPYIEEMAAAYAWADLVVCRAGALTVSELAAAGVPAILVPFPYAVDDHQTRNARHLTDAGAAVLVPQAELSPERLAGLLEEFIRTGRERLRAMAESARRLAQPEATALVTRQCLAAARGESLV